MTDSGQTGTEREETTNEKGDRHENEARHILKRVYGAGVSKVGCRGVHDPFGFVDLIAMQPGEPVKFVQVKTNGFSAEARRKYRSRTRKLPPQYAVFEVWVRHDRQGWVLHEYDPESREFSEFHRIDVCDRSEAGDRYREFAQEQNPPTIFTWEDLREAQREFEADTLEKVPLGVTDTDARCGVRSFLNLLKELNRSVDTGASQ